LSNIDKYESRNPLKRLLLERFLRRTRAAIPADPETILDLGVGEGLFWEEPRDSLLVGVDIRFEALVASRDRATLTPVCASADHLPYVRNAFDFVIAIEILEHLQEPKRAVAEISRVAQRGALITVPWEPWFSLLLLGAGQHLRRLGREPEHVQAFGPREFLRLLKPHFERVAIQTCFPWLVAEVRCD